MPATAHVHNRLVRPNGIGYSVAEFSHACLIRLIDYPALPLQTNTQETIKAGRTALIVRTEFPLQDQHVPVAYKRVRRRNWLKVLTAFVRTNRTLRTYRLGHLFLKRGITTARPLVAIVPRFHRIGGDSFLLTEWIEGSINLHHYLEWLGEIDPQDQSQKLNAVAEKLGDLLGRMHSCGISHRDLKPSNLLVADRGEGISVYIIDLDGADVSYRVSRKRRDRDLARLVVGLERMGLIGNSLRLRFLKAYQYGSDSPLDNWKESWRRLVLSSERLTARKQRRKRRAERWTSFS
jgi:tRNA A-37 threonylcarbamoyl transferase component Bud32